MSLIKITQNKTKDENQRNVIFPLDNRHFITVFFNLIPLDFSGAYWCLVVVIYLGWSFWTNNWKMTWIIWPVAGVLYAAILGIVKMIVRNKDE